MEWSKIKVSLDELSLSTVLRCGQSFRWRNFGDKWLCALNGRIIILKQDSEYLYYKAVFPADSSNSNKNDTEIIIKDYFNLSVNLQSLYKEWSERDAHFKKAIYFQNDPNSRKLTGIRILRQNPWETLCAFICSSNNNIKRISKMVESLCSEFGTYIATYDGIPFHDFPSPKNLLSTDSVELKLRKLGFGYRAKYLVATANKCIELGGEKNLQDLRNSDRTYQEVTQYLRDNFSGVGPKVADCVCLMALDKTDSVPIDTHVWQIAHRDYNFRIKKPKTKTKTKIKTNSNSKTNITLSKQMYDAVSDHFRSIWGDYAGWAHSVLFTADLKDLNNGINDSTKNNLIKTDKKRTINEEITTEKDDTSSTLNSQSSQQIDDVKSITTDCGEFVNKKIRVSKRIRDKKIKLEI